MMSGEISTRSSKGNLTRKVHYAVAKAGQKLRSKNKTEKTPDFLEIKKLRENVKEQHEMVIKLYGDWKKLREKAIEVSQISKDFEGLLMRSAKVDNNTSDKIEKSIVSFPDTNDTKIDEKLQTLKTNLEKLLKSLKDAEAKHRDYIANKAIYDKANDSKKEQERQEMERSLESFQQCASDLKNRVPNELLKNDSELYCVLKCYFQSKYSYLNSTFSETKNLVDNISDAREPYRTSHYCTIITDPPQNGGNSTTNEYQTQSNECVTLSDNNTNSNVGTCKTEIYPSLPETSPRDSDSGKEPSDADLATLKPPFKVVASYAYSSEEPDELSFHTGDVITVLPWPDPKDEEPEWLYGRLESKGTNGLFPANHVKLA